MRAERRRGSRSCDRRPQNLPALDGPGTDEPRPGASRERVREFRRANSDAYYFNWILHVENEFQKPFHPTHENMSKLELHKKQDNHLLAANLRRAFSGIVSGNVKEEGIGGIAICINGAVKIFPNFCPYWKKRWRSDLFLIWRVIKQWMKSLKEKSPKKHPFPKRRFFIKKIN